MDIRQLHREAVELAKQANKELQDGNNIGYLDLAAKALAKEKKAALELIGDFDAEPTRSVLFRSAATIAFNIGSYDESLKLTHLALAGNPYEEIKVELEELLENAQMAVENNSTKVIGLENAYIESLREKAINIKLEPVENRYSKAIVLDYITDFLKNIQNCFSNFSEVSFKKAFSFSDFTDYDKTLNLFKKDTKALCVGLKFKSFGVSVAVDTSLMNYRDITSPKFKDFKGSIFTQFKEDVLMAEFNDSGYQKKIKKKFTDQERNLIFGPLVDSLKEKSKYRISIVDKEFKETVKSVPVINSKSMLVMKPPIEKGTQFDDSEILLKRTLELTNPSGQKGEKILSEALEYAEFKVTLKDLTIDGRTAYFINPYEQKVIFNRGTFLIDDEIYKIYVEGPNFQEMENIFAKELISKFESLLNKESEAQSKKEQLNVDDKNILDSFKNTIMKGW